LTIDQLSSVTGVPSRTIRMYQTKGVLPPAPRQGRVSQYGADHVDRLRLIGDLQDRGLQLTAIRDLLSHCDREITIREWLGLGLGEHLGQPWSEDSTQWYPAADLESRLAGRHPGTLSELLRTGVLQRHDEGPPAVYEATSPGLLEVALALDDAGVDFATSAAAAAILRRRLAQAVGEVIRLLIERAGCGFGRDATPDALAAAFEGIRVTGGEATRLIFAAEVERAVSQLGTEEAP
jgi:DNA-binding transcriptional MerR regulator